MHTDNRYDVWKCAKCGGVRIVHSLPHNPPACCGTTMWWQELRIGKTYTWEQPDPLQIDMMGG